VPVTFIFNQYVFSSKIDCRFINSCGKLKSIIFRRQSLKFPPLSKASTILFKRILPISISLFLIFSLDSSWAQVTTSACGTDIMCASPQICVNGYCCVPGACIAQFQCGSSDGFDSYCHLPCSTATPGTCPGTNEPSTYTTCTNNTCVCTPDGGCNALACDSTQGIDSCGQSCVAGSPVICPSNQYCNTSTHLCNINLNSSQASVAPNNQSTTPDPINIFSGEDYFSSTDFSYGAEGPRLELFRKYRSFSAFMGMFGYGWRTAFDINLTQDSSGNVTIYDEQGTQLNFAFMSNTDTYTANQGNFNSLVKNPDNTFTLSDKNGVKRVYDTTGRLIKMIDRNDNILSFVYSPSVPGGTYIQDANGRQIILNIDLNGHIISAKSPDGKIFQYGYDANGNLVSVTDPTGAVTNYTYDSNHKIIQFTNANSHNTYYQYDAQGRAVMTWRDNNINKTGLNYQANNTTVVADSLGKNNTYVFNSIGLQISRTDPLGNFTQQTWDGNMDRTSLTDARNNVTYFVYDSKGNLIQMTDPVNNKTLMTYTPNFNLIASKTDALANVTTFIYDSNGNLTSVTDALGKTHSFIYDQFGNIVTETDSRGNSTNLTYDIFGHVIQKTDALGNKTNFTYE